MTLSNPFDLLSSDGLAVHRPPEAAANPKPDGKKSLPGSGHRLEIRRLKAGKGGKTVTEVSGLHTFDSRQRDAWLKELKSRLGVGGRFAGTAMEIQGDQREAVEKHFAALGFRVVRAGG